MRQFTCPKAVTHPSTNRARCRATALIETNTLPLHQTANLMDEPGLAGFIGTTDDGSGGDSRSYKTCKWSPPTNQHQTFYRPDALPVAKPTVSKHWRERAKV